MHLSMKTTLFVLSLALLAQALAPLAAHAQEACGMRAKIIGQLNDKYHETRRGVGLAANNSVLEIFAADTGSWTILITDADGQSCLVASGQHYETVRETLPAAGKGI